MELVYIFLFVLFVLFCCVDFFASSVTLWIDQNWFVVKAIVYALFLLIILIEVLSIRKKYSKGLICWFAGWNTLRSIVAAEYLIFILSDLKNYSTWGFFDKLLSILGILVVLLPLFAYNLFEITIDEVGDVTYKSVFLGGLLACAGIVFFAWLLGAFSL